jgi:dsDNA-specific endonuclease/ATPase MutS2
LEIGDSLDLHTFHPRDIPDVVREYLWEAVRRGFREVRIIHGKGTGFQREVVRKVLESHPAVRVFGPAPAERGHWGATLVLLESRPTHEEPQRGETL